MYKKFELLNNYIKSLDTVCLAYSGGTDSALLLYLLKNLNLKAVTFKSPFQTEEEIKEALDFAEKIGVKVDIIEFNPLQNQNIINNPKERCYFCKFQIFSKLKSLYPDTKIFDGTNYDDLNKFRPGLKALSELKVISPLAEFKITKDEIRQYAKIIGLKIYNKSSSPCIATRFPYGTRLTTAGINAVIQGEKILKNSGFKNCRLRAHNEIARIEIPKTDFKRFFTIYEKITKELKTTGFKFITLDLEGIKSGSFD